MTTMTEMRVHMDCAGCESKIRKSLEKVKGVDNVEIDMAMQKVTVTGWADQKKILKTVRRTGKRAEIWQFPHNPEMRNNHNYVTDHYYQQQGCGGPSTYYAGEPPASAYNYRKHGCDNYGRAYSLYRGNSNTFGSRAGDTFSDENPNGCHIM
ncbi:heavy metal-associated isoprenylated plant protein 28-like [Nicotiana tabacum]|uniref:Heavy metal-associated isoprenylated plant protein 22-like isoform X1 n=1 Tax=Nicotiana tabacum TaxID=4097 RepID=A0A1S3XW45_TOBAC|nr:PREDICTED: heavy metal-associated isoprenylated plant protein 22-like isoform X1 [Nicotiana tabacum]